MSTPQPRKTYLKERGKGEGAREGAILEVAGGMFHVVWPFSVPGQVKSYRRCKNQRPTIHRCPKCGQSPAKRKKGG